MPSTKNPTRCGLFDEDTTRRDFLRTTLGGVVAASGVVAVLLPESSRALATPTYDWTRHRWVYLVDARECIGCGACVRACRVENDVPEGMYRTWVERYEIPAEGEPVIDSPHGGSEGFQARVDESGVRKAFFVPKLCNHCEETPCTQVCPVGASYSTEDGVVLVDKDRCIGCGYCVQACPYGSRYINPDTHTADKCTWCYHRLTKGMKPACVEICPRNARMIGDRKDPDDPIHEILDKEHVMVLQPHLLTKPQTYYLGLSMEVR